MFLVLFWLAAILLAYTYLLFPILVYARSLMRPRPWKRESISPSVSLIVAAYNEESSIGAKLDNLSKLVYPNDALEVIIASDGSNDRTDEIVASRTGEHLRLLQLPRRGKAAALNRVVAVARGEILVFSDANSMWEPEALQTLVSNFADPLVGGVAGDQRYLKRRARSVTDQGERGYWGFDRWLKYHESRAGNVISATGAIYAIRKSLFLTVPEGVTDDFITSTAVIQQRSRLVFEPNAVAWEPVAGRSSDEFGRKVRVITRGLRGVLMRRNLMAPWSFGFYAVQLVTHKLLRRLMVLPLMVLYVSSIFLASTHTFYLMAAILQSIFYGLALLGATLSRTSFGRMKCFSIPAYFVMVNVACLVAIQRVLTGSRVVLWETARTGSRDSLVTAGQSEGQSHAQP